MTPEQKAEAYDKVKEKIALRFGSTVAEEIFSEFEMSEDERIRKTLIELVEDCKESSTNGGFGGLKWDILLAWLEKQQEEPHVYKTEDGKLTTYRENVRLLNKVVETDLKEMVKAEPKSFEELKDQDYVNIP